MPLESSSVPPSPLQPLISVITVVFNGADWIDETIQSVLNQTYRNFEYIIIDGGSTDGTVDRLQSYGSQIHHWVSEPDRGIYDAMNKGIQRAQGEIIGLINCGDDYFPHTLEAIRQAYVHASQSSQALVLTGAMYRTNQAGDVIFKLNQDLTNLETAIQWGMPIHHPATFVTKAVYEQVGLFDEKFKICGDYDFIYRAYHHPSVQFVAVDSVLAAMRLGGVSEEFKSLPRRGWEHYIIKQDLMGWPRNLSLTLLWFIQTLGKYLLRDLAPVSLLNAYYRLRHGPWDSSKV